MAATCDKENGGGSSSGALFSPSKYQAKIGRTSSEGLFGRLLQARNEAKTECDSKLAAKLRAKLEEEERAMKVREEEEEKASRELAERLHQEAKDGIVAQQISLQELENMKKWRTEVATIEAEDRKLVEKMMSEEEEFRREQELQARRDEQHAAKLQESEVEEVARFIKMVSKRWKKPKIVCSDVEEGMLITVALPHVASMKVHVDETENVITVVASPDFSYISKFRGKIPEHMQPKAVDINLDLKIVGKDDVSVDDVKTRYDAEAEMAYIYVCNACLKTNTNAFVQRLQHGLKRILRKPSFLGKKK